MCAIDGWITVNSMQKETTVATHRIIRMQNKKKDPGFCMCFASFLRVTWMIVLVLHQYCIVRINRAICSSDSCDWQSFKQVRKRGRRARDKKEKRVSGFLIVRNNDLWIKRRVSRDISQRMWDELRAGESGEVLDYFDVKVKPRNLHLL